MKKLWNNRNLIAVYLFILSLGLALPLCGNHAVNVLSEQTQLRQTVIIDAGHGGVDGGAVSCTGVYESHINLQIALKLNDLMHLLGVDTVMIRTTDCSVHTQGETIAAKKVSDIKERVRIANTTPKALYLSIHQNHYSDSRYWGAQVFYNDLPESKALAQCLQNNLRSHISADNKRKPKRSNGVYLMEHISCPGLLIECGFLSNPQEEDMLRSDDYQRRLCSVIAVTAAEYLNT